MLNTEKQKKTGFQKKQISEITTVFDKFWQKYLTIYKNYDKNQISNGRGAGFKSIWILWGTVHGKGKPPKDRLSARGSGSGPSQKMRWSVTNVERYHFLEKQTFPMNASSSDAVYGYFFAHFKAANKIKRRNEA